MWDTAPSSDMQLSHDMPCQRCGHALHVFLSCDEDCGCRAERMPGELALVRG